MATADYTISRSGRRAVSTGADARASDFIDRKLADQHRSNENSWRRLIDHPLIDWWQDPAQLDDDGLRAPSRERIEQAVQIADKSRESGFPAPLRIVPDGYGGIVFEFRKGLKAASLRIAENGDTEFIVFDNDAIVSRRQVP